MPGAEKGFLHWRSVAVVVLLAAAVLNVDGRKNVGKSTDSFDASVFKVFIVRLFKNNN